jgi:regulator of protease activity HflC (stomatin/prohibitin superfamily)
MNVRVFGIIVGVVFLVLLSMFGCNRIDAGHVGIKVNLYGTDKGVSDITEVTGMVWYNRWYNEVYEVPTFVQNVVYSHEEINGSDEDEEFRVTTKDGMIARFDVSMNYLTPDSTIVPLFRKYRKPVKELERGVLRTFLREGFNKTASKYTAEQLYENRAQFEIESQNIVKDILLTEGFVVEQLVILNEIRLPEDVTARINDKVKAAQITKQKQEEVKQEEADAQKRIAKAIGDSTSLIISANAKAGSMLIKAEAEQKSYRLKKQELTEQLLKQQMIEKWDGKLPVYGQTPELFRSVAK